MMTKDRVAKLIQTESVTHQIPSPELQMGPPDPRHAASSSMGSLALPGQGRAEVKIDPYGTPRVRATTKPPPSQET